ncbi:DnaJ domain-containing protein/DUF3444 domain-containing protein [Cephalotus follicularis]|uniref:DnaJ domain-containing protein/DUF3444 domain-containing protein n=1 Tax=Cephalotus follicularis TaxID=3775 RepID=A0A1Q3B5V3_CEPFO|nr:DnaJ domain-containing protein/DUF3444 domain-containing protein [Cephalotus follicularis]
MECNREEALRAKEIAENKMQNKDFSGARKIALKAQKLYSDLENVSQMLMVCDVHCAAENKLFGNEMDWYNILQIEQSVDEATIKKQYRKFALLLHPDKNKFPGAEAAFKLIGEAQRVLLDRGQRSLHDMKRRAPVIRPAPTYRPPQKANIYSNVGIQQNFMNNFVGLNPQQQQPQRPFQQQPQRPPHQRPQRPPHQQPQRPPHQQPQRPPQAGFSNGRPTFWTICPYCSVKYQFYREIIHKSIHCQTCEKSFIAYESCGPEAPPATNFSQPVFPQQKNVSYQGAGKVEEGGQGSFVVENSKTSKTGYASHVGREKVNGTRGRKQVAESSESCNSESSYDLEENMVIDDDGDLQAGQNIGCSGAQFQRRSERRKQPVSYKENLSDDDDFVSPPKRAKGIGSTSATEEERGYVLKEDVPFTNRQSGLAAEVNDNKITQKQKESVYVATRIQNGKEESDKVTRKETTVDDDFKKSAEARADVHNKNSETSADSLSDSSSKDPEIYSYPDPDFNDFDKDRKEECFELGQIWSVYDDLDAMPRFYALIRKVFSPGFKLEIVWLEADPNDENGIEWVSQKLPVSCGKYKYGDSEITKDRLMFSHLMYWDKGSRRGTYNIFPR